MADVRECTLNWFIALPIPLTWLSSFLKNENPLAGNRKPNGVRSDVDDF